MTQLHFQVPSVWRSLLRTNRFLVGLVAVLGLGLVAGAAAVVVNVTGGGGEAASSATHPAGATVKDSWFTFRVAGVQTRKHVTGEGGDATAKGTFVLVSLNVTNHDDKPWAIFAEDQKLHAAGQIYGIDFRATVDLDKGPEAGLQKNLNPGVTEQVTVAYDVPAGATAQTMELHGAPKSHGVKVALPTI